MRKQECGGLSRMFLWAFWFWSAQLIGSVAFAQDTQAPTTPTNFSVTASSSTIAILDWNPSSDNVAVTGYQIERCQGVGCNSGFTQFGSSNDGWANTGLTPGTTYGYRIRAYDAVPNYSAFTSIVHVTTPAAADTQAPTTPTNFTVTASSSTIAILDWNPSSDNVAVTGYQIERCQGVGCNSGFTQFGSSNDGWANTGLTPGTTYGYRIRAYDAVPNYSAFTGILYVTTPAAGGDTQAPTTPTNFSVTASSSTIAILDWNPSSDNVAVTGYQIERCQGVNCSSGFTQFGSSNDGWANTGLTPGTTYGYRIRAYDAVPNYSAFTSILYATTPAAGGDTQAPTTPTGFTVTASSGTAVTLNWNPSSDNVGVTGYQIERCQGAGCSSSFTQFSSSSVGWANSGLTLGTTYGYRVRARDAVPNYSAFTSIVYVTTNPVHCD